MTHNHSPKSFVSRHGLRFICMLPLAEKCSAMTRSGKTHKATARMFDGSKETRRPRKDKQETCKLANAFICMLPLAEKICSGQLIFIYGTFFNSNENGHMCY